jgi:hypothetical protein
LEDSGCQQLGEGMGSDCYGVLGVIKNVLELELMVVQLCDYTKIQWWILWFVNYVSI